MAAIWKSLLLLHLGLSCTAALEAGDCAFVGIYGDKDDFALVLLEDADEQIYLTEELQSTRKVSKFIEGKDKVKDAKRGTVLRKEDFVTSEASLVAPLAITAFSGSPSSPSILCSIRLNENPGASARMLQELNVVSVQSDTATYVGSTSGTKDELLTEIRDSSNWIDGTSFRKLRGFTVANGNGGNHSDTMTTSMNPNPNMTVTETTTMEDDDDDTSTTDDSGGPSPPPPPPPPSSTTTPGKTDSGNAAALGISLGFLLVSVSVM